MDSRPVSPSMLRAFTPLAGMRAHNLHALCRTTQLRAARLGHLVFREGDVDQRTYFLVSGTVELFRAGRIVDIIRAGSVEARSALAPITPRRFTACVSSSRAEFAIVDTGTLDVMLTWDRTGIYEVGEIAPSESASLAADWMTALLQTKALHRLSPANLQAIFTRMQRVEYSAGEVVIREGEPGEYFYVIVNGTCAVTRHTPLSDQPIRLAELAPGETFGEEALIADTQCDTTITMQSTGVLMRLAKADFLPLLVDPLLRRIDLARAEQIVAQGGRWLDVRLPHEFDRGHLRGAENLPLHCMRLKLKQLDRQRHYVTYCDGSRRSSVAAYLLSERGFEASALSGPAKLQLDAYIVCVGLSPPSAPAR